MKPKSAARVFESMDVVLAAGFLSRMQRDYVYPAVCDRLSPNEWKEVGSVTAVQRARDKVTEILGGYFPRHIDDATDAAIRASYPVRLAPEDMGR